MPSAGAIGIQGDRKLIRKLRRMDLSRRDVLTAMRPGARLVRDTARHYAPKGTGVLAKSIKVKTLRGDPPTLAIRPEYRRRTSKKTGKVTSAGFHAHLVEFGTQGNRPAVKGGGTRIANINGKTVRITHTGRMPARPFMRPAWDATHNQVNRGLRAEFWKIVKGLVKLERRR